MLRLAPTMSSIMKLCALKDSSDYSLVLTTLASRWNKEKFSCYEAKIEESEKAASALPLSYDNRTTEAFSTYGGL